MTIRAVTASFLICDARIVPRRLHAVIPPLRIIAVGDVLAGLIREVFERRRETVGEVLLRHATQALECLVESLGECREALAADDHLGVAPAALGKPEIVDPMIEGLSAHRDHHILDLGEV